MLKALLHDRKLLSLLFLALLVKLLALSPAWVERYYTYGFYPYISGALRFLFGWLPFSVGDLVYASAAVYLALVIWKFITLFRRGELRKNLYTRVFRFIRVVLLIYVIFNLFWGLNYNRRGIAYQLGLDVDRYSTADVAALASRLTAKLNTLAGQVDSVKMLQLNRNRTLFRGGIQSYHQVAKDFRFLAYTTPSVKPSMYSGIGHYFGFTGYYNPFSGEAQIKTSVPAFLKPFIMNHEIAHQLGYGKENEANFVAYIACKNDTDINFRYSAYFELSLYALGNLRGRDSVAAKALKATWPPRVQADYQAYKDYILKSANPIEPLITRFYDQYLKLNAQRKGIRTYNEVVAWLVAYMKKGYEI